jgi:L-asparaginase / beta-aspartyl-peptidase
VLAGGGTAVDCVEAAVRVLEDNPRFNAGLGSVLNERGEVEMDALIMAGADRSLGAVTGVRRTANPVTLARAVMEHSPHVLLAGDAGDAFAARMGLPQVPADALVTPARRSQLDGVLASRRCHPLHDDTCTSAVGGAGLSSSSSSSQRLVMGEGGAVAVVGDPGHGAPPAAEVDTGQHDTVGAVALDANGHTAAATSTGGLCGKWPGRVGDSPLVGCGGFAADDAGGAASTTGTGELIARFMLAREAVAAVPVAGVGDGGGMAADAAASAAVGSALRRMAAAGLDGPEHGHGVILVTRAGGFGIAHSSARMSWAVALQEPAAAGGAVSIRAGVRLESTEGDAVRTNLPT